MNTFLFYVILVVIFDTAAVVLAKVWALNKNPFLLIATVILFALVGLFFAYSNQFKELAIANVFWTALSTVVIAILGYFLFKESLGIFQMAGIAAIIIGLILINIK